jgi:hypothetical protein
MKAHRRNVLLGVALLTAVALAAAYFLHFRARWAVERYERQLTAAGETLSVQSLYPPAVLPENNGAPLFCEVMGPLALGSTLLETNAPAAMRMVAPDKAAVGWAQPDLRWDGTNTWEEVDAALGKYQDALAVVREAAEHPVLDFQLDYHQGFTLLLPHLAPLKRATQLLSADTLSDLRRGDAGAATTNLNAMLGLVRGTANERLAISQLVRIAMAAIAMNATWEFLQSPRVTEDQLAMLQRDWAGLTYLQPANDMLAMERAIGLMMMQRMRRSSAELQQALSTAGGGSMGSGLTLANLPETLIRETIAGARRTSWRLSASYADQLRALAGYQVLLDSVRAVQAGQPFLPALSRQQARLAALELHPEKEDSGRRFDPSNPDLLSLFTDSVISLHRVLNREMMAEVSRGLATTALALKRYQLRHGQYPAELSALVPELLPAVPRDPADGKPLRYQLRSDGTFLLYSIGEDGVDNGGDASAGGKSDTFAWQKGHDLVWPCPATAEEVRAYQEKQASKRSR